VKKPRTLKDPPIGPATPKFSPQSQLGFAWRVGTEFISGIFVGLLLGYAIDHVFGAKPWGLVVMVMGMKGKNTSMFGEVRTYVKRSWIEHDFVWSV